MRYFLLFLALFSCSSTVPYEWYVMEKVDYSKGALLRKGDAKDFSFCSPDKYEKRKCAVMTLDAFQNLLEDYVDMQERLKACEKANR